MDTPRGESTVAPRLGRIRRWVESGETWADRFARRHGSEALPLLTLFVVGGGLAVWWTYIDWVRLATFHLPAYDLGVNYQAVWAASHGYRTDASGPIGYRLIVYVFVVPYYLAPSGYGFLQFLLVVQNVWLLLGALPLYFVARDVLRSRSTGTAVALGYLLYAPVSGPLWFPFHMQALFPTLFLFGYWRYRRGDFRTALPFFALALITNIGAPIVLACFALGIFVEPRLPKTLSWLKELARRLWREEYSLPPIARRPVQISRRDAFGLLLLGGAALEFALLLAYYGFWAMLYFIGQSSFSSGSGLGRALPLDPLANGALKGWTLLAIFLPVLFLPLFGREERWALIPFLIAGILTANHPAFLFPFKDQYLSYLIPGVMAGTVRGLERLEARRTRPRPTLLRRPGPVGRVRRWNRRLTPTQRAAFVLVTVMVSSAFLAPWSPGNGLLAQYPGWVSGHYPLHAVTSGNATVDRELRDLVGRVPNSGWLLFQNNLPVAMAREHFYVPGFYEFGQPLDYLVNDPYDLSFYGGQNFGPDSHSMQFWSNRFLNDSGWGVMAQVDGALLLARGYQGPPVLYAPLTETLGPSAFACCSWTNASTNATAGPVYLVSGPRLPIDGEYTVFSPGSFHFRFTLLVDHPKPWDQLTIQLAGDGGATPLLSRNVSGGAWSDVSGAVTVDLSLTLYQYVAGMHISVRLLDWQEPIRFLGLSIVQTAPANPRGT